MLYLVFNEGYSRGHSDRDDARLRNEAIRLARLLLGLFPGEPEIMGLLQHARNHARCDADGQLVLLDRQARSLWNPAMITEGRSLVEKALRHQESGTYPVQAAIAARHARAKSAEHTDWAAIDRLYRTLETIQPSPVVTLNRPSPSARRAAPPRRWPSGSMAISISTASAAACSPSSTTPRPSTAPLPWPAHPRPEPHPSSISH